jgi:hypothetical protein
MTFRKHTIFSSSTGLYLRSSTAVINENSLWASLGGAESPTHRYWSDLRQSNMTPPKRILPLGLIFFLTVSLWPLAFGLRSIFSFAVLSSGPKRDSQITDSSAFILSWLGLHATGAWPADNLCFWPTCHLFFSAFIVGPGVLSVQLHKYRNRVCAIIFPSVTKCAINSGALRSYDSFWY